MKCWHSPNSPPFASNGLLPIRSFLPWPMQRNQPTPANWQNIRPNSPNYALKLPVSRMKSIAFKTSVTAICTHIHGGDWLATGSDGIIRLWDSNTGKIARRMARFNDGMHKAETAAPWSARAKSFTTCSAGSGTLVDALQTCEGYCF